MSKKRNVKKKTSVKKKPSVKTPGAKLSKSNSKLTKTTLKKETRTTRSSKSVKPVTTTKTGTAKPAATKTQVKTSGKKPINRKRQGLNILNATLKVLSEARKPMRCNAMVEVMLKKDYWQTNGKTPEQTLYSSILREIQNKGKEARFKKVERGLFGLVKK